MISNGPIIRDLTGYAEFYLFAGQSNSGGTSSLPLLSTTSPANSFMFENGVRLDPEHGGARVPNPGNLVPLLEIQNTGALNYGFGETWASGFAETMRDKGHKPPMIFAAGGVGGTSIDDMQEGSNAFENQMDAIAKAKETYPKLVVPAIFLSQGYNDRNKTLAAHFSALETLLESYQRRITAITGQTSKPLLVITQCGAWTKNFLTQIGTTTSEVPQAQLELAKANPYVRLAFSYYHYAPWPNDGIHFESYANRQIGESFAHYMADIARFPLPDISGQVNGNNVVLTVNNWGDLEVDTNLVTAVANHGFTLTGATINNVSVAGNQITIGFILGTPTEVGYAMEGVVDNDIGRIEGPRGNIRQADVWFNSRYDNAPVHRWLPHFRLAL